MADDDDDFSDTPLPNAPGVSSTLPPAAAGNTNPFPIESQPGSPTAMQINSAQFSMMMENMRLASQAVLAAAGNMNERRAPIASSTSGFSDANRILNRPASFGSTSHDHDCASWPDWSHAFRSWLIFAEGMYETELKVVEDNLSVVQNIATMPAASADRSRRLYAILASLLQHRPKAMLRQVEGRCGYETWRQLVNSYAPRSKVRGLALLNAIMTLPSFTKDKTMREQIDGLERIAQEYEKVSGSPISPDILLGTLIRVLPQQLRSHIQLQMTEKSTFTDVKQYCLAYEVTTSTWSAAKVHQSLGVVAPPPAPASDGPVPMDIDQIAAQVMALTKGKGKGKGKKGKDGKKQEKGGKGKADQGFNAKGQPKGGKQGKGQGKAKGSKGKGKGQGKGQQGQPKCWNCNRYGHVQKDCPNPTVNQVEANTDAASTVAPSQSASQTHQSTVRRLEAASSAADPEPLYFDFSIMPDIIDASVAMISASKLLRPCASDDPPEGDCVCSFEEGSVHPCQSSAVAPCVHHDMTYSDNDDSWTVCSPKSAWSLFADDVDEPDCDEPDDLNAPDCDDAGDEVSDLRTAARACRQSAPPGTWVQDVQVENMPQVFPCVRAVIRELEGEEVPVIMDSGADISCLPFSLGWLGTRGRGGPNLRVSDAQGGELPVQQHRDVEFVLETRTGQPIIWKERCVVTSVTQPLLALGKFMRAGWCLTHSRWHGDVLEACWLWA